MTVRIGRYQLRERIAHGGMAEVYLARQLGPAGFEKDVVVKCILPRYAEDAHFRRMFLDEARLAARLSHPNIVEIYELGETSGRYFIAMEYVWGVSLGELTRRAARLGVRLPAHFAARIAADVLAGLDHIHHVPDASGEPSSELVHRDVSPDNVLLSYHGSVKLIDFGVAGIVAGEGDDEAEAASGQGPRNGAMVKGKFGYMSPEQALGGELDGRSDLFGVGVLLYEAVTGARPFGDGRGLRTVAAIVNEEPVPPREQSLDVPRELEDAILRALAKNRDQRYGSAREMKRELETFIERHARYVGHTDLGELARRLIRGREEDVQWIRRRQNEVSAVPLAAVGGADEPQRAEAANAEGDPVLDRGTLRNAGRFGGVGVASGHLAVLHETPADGTDRVPTRSRARMRRWLRRGGVALGILLAALLLLALGWWLGARRPSGPATSSTEPGAGGTRLVRIVPPGGAAPGVTG